MKRILSLLFFVSITFGLKAAIVDTIQVYSAAMQKNIKVVTITPDSYASAKELPVVYLLHGYSGNHLDWINKAKGFEKAADIHNLIS